MDDLELALKLMGERKLAESREVLARATAGGEPEAALMEVALTANGSGGDPDWPRAVALLRDAAERFGGAAREHLELIEAMNIDSEGNPAILPPAEELSRTPYVRRWRGLLTQAECAHLAHTASDLLEPSMVAHPQTGELVAHPIRTSSAAQIGPTRESLPVQAILRRIAAITTTDVRQGEALTVLHYAPGQEYRLHLDALPRTANQRVATVLVYLNEGYAGGETRFEASGLAVCGRGGDAIAFSNTLDDGTTPDPASRHMGMPVRQGAKWLATRWIRARPFDVWKGPEQVSVR